MAPVAVIEQKPIGGRQQAIGRVVASTCGLIRIGLGVIFLWTSLSKLQEPLGFLSAIYNYELVGRMLGLALAFIIPWLELVLGLSLILGMWVRGGLVVSIVLLSLFLVARCLVVSRGLPIPCGCCPRQGEPMTYRDILLTGGLLLGAIMALAVTLKMSLTGTKQHFESIQVAED